MTRASIAAATLLLASVACSADSPEPTDVATAAGTRVELAADAAFRARIDAIRYYNGISRSEQRVVRDRRAWEAFWSRATELMRPVPEAPEVDFTRNVVVIVALGTRPTGGYAVVVDGVYETSGGLQVDAIASSPGDRCATTDALTQPLDAVVVPRRVERVTFRVTDVVRDCR